MWGTPDPEKLIPIKEQYRYFFTISENTINSWKFNTAFSLLYQPNSALVNSISI